MSTKQHISLSVDHALQDGVLVADNKIKVGSLFTEDYYDLFKNGSYSATLYFKIPEDLQKYVIGYRLAQEVGIIKEWLNVNLGTFYSNSYTKTTNKITGAIEYNNTSMERKPANAPITGAKTEPGILLDYHTGSPYVKVDTPDYIVASEIRFTEYATKYITILDSQYIVIEINFANQSNYTQKEYEYLIIENKYTSYYEISDLSAFTLEFDIETVDQYVIPTYPVDVYVRKDRNLVAAWDVANSANRDTDMLYITGSNVKLTDANGTTLEYNIVGDAQNIEISASDLSSLTVGQATIEVTVFNNYDQSGSATYTFDLTGQTNAPEITSITQDSYPTVNWIVDSQISWEMIVKRSNNVVYASGPKVGNARSFTLPVLLEDGTYSFEMRALNIYGTYTAWSSFLLVLNPEKPSAPTGVIVSANDKFGISVNCNNMETNGKLLVMRRKDSDSLPEVISEYTKDNLDYLIPLNTPYEYTIRNYDGGYADGPWIDGTVKASGVVIRDADNYLNFVNVWRNQSNENDYRISEDRSDVLIKCVGRSYEVLEVGEWYTSQRQFSGHVTDEDFQKLIGMKKNSSHVILQANGECIPCHLGFSDNGEYTGDGRIVTFSLSRIDGDR